jgi:hypothetical protein
MQAKGQAITTGLKADAYICLSSKNRIEREFSADMGPMLTFLKTFCQKTRQKTGIFDLKQS